MLKLDAGKVAEHDRGEMSAGARAKRGIIEFSGMRLGVVDQFLDRAKWRIRRYEQDILGGRHQHDRIEIRDRVEILARLQGHVHGEALRAEMQCVAVGCRFRRRRGADVPARTWTVLDDDVFPPRLGELLRENAAERVDRAAGRKRNHDAHGTLGIILPRCAADTGGK